MFSQGPKQATIEAKANDVFLFDSKGPLNHLIAVEIVTVPQSMRAGRIGYYTWDPLPDTSGIDVSGPTVTNMTNGLVSSVSPATPTLTNTNMTNGIVTSEENGAAGRTLTVAQVGPPHTTVCVFRSAFHLLPSKWAAGSLDLRRCQGRPPSPNFPVRTQTRW